jgi:hypothetical protein
VTLSARLPGSAGSSSFLSTLDRLVSPKSVAAFGAAPTSPTEADEADASRSATSERAWADNHLTSAFSSAPTRVSGGAGGGGGGDDDEAVAGDIDAGESAAGPRRRRWSKRAERARIVRSFSNGFFPNGSFPNGSGSQSLLVASLVDFFGAAPSSVPSSASGAIIS